MLAILMALLLSTASQDMVVLKSPVLRLEVDPQTFSLRYVGLPGGYNFVQPNYLDDIDRLEATWLDAGGLYAGIGLSTDEDAALRRGPAVEVEQGESFVALLGPWSEKHGLRFKKEVHLDNRSGSATYTLTLYAKRHTPKNIAIETLCQIPPGTVVVGLDEDRDEQGRWAAKESEEEETFTDVTVILHES